MSWFGTSSQYDTEYTVATIARAIILLATIVAYSILGTGDPKIGQIIAPYKSPHPYKSSHLRT